VGRLFFIHFPRVNISHFTVYAYKPGTGYPVYAMKIEYADNCTITNNTIIDSYIGVRIDYSDNTLILNNTIKDNAMGVYFYYSNFTRIIGNNVSSHKYEAIRGDDSWNARIIGNSAFFNEYEVISSNWSNGTLIEGNTVSWNDEHGISIFRTVESRIINNTISHNYQGIWSSFCDGNWIENNTIENINRTSISTLEISNITVSNNTIIDSNVGIYVDNSENITVSYNSVANTKRAIMIRGGIGQRIIGNVMVGGGIYPYSDVDFLNTVIIDSNTVNGKPVLFWRSVTGEIVPLDMGQIILANCFDVTVQNQNIDNTSIGIFLAYVSNTSITDNEVEGSISGIHIFASNNNRIEDNYVHSNEENGIVVHYSNYNVVDGNTAWNTHGGIYLDNIDLNTISNNTASMNDEYGIMIDYSRQNTLISNMLENNGIGMWVYRSHHNTIVSNNISYNHAYGMMLNWSQDNLIYHNYFIENSIQVLSDPGLSYTNTWDDGYPSGGNFWSDYSLLDMMSGPDQSQPGSDGIGDTPYLIEGSTERDDYPILDPFTPGRTYFPSPPRYLSAIPGVEEVILTWGPPIFTGNAPIICYRIYRGEFPGDLTFLAEVSNVSMYVDANLTAGQIYYYTVTAVNSAGEGHESYIVHTIPLAPPPDPRERWNLILAASVAIIVMFAVLVLALARMSKSSIREKEPPEIRQNETIKEPTEDEKT